MRGLAGTVGGLMGERRTAWHYFLDLLLESRAPRHFEIRGEEPLTRALQHVDWLVLRRRGRAAPGDRGGTLVDLWPLLPAVTVAEFKSTVREYRAREFDRLVGYGHQYFSAHPEEVSRREELALVLMVAERNGALDADLAELGLRERPLVRGYSALDGLAFRTILVDFRALVARAPEEYVALFVRGAAVVEAAHRWWYSRYGTRRDDRMDPSKLEDFDDVVRRFMELMPLEERLAGISPEQIARTLTPEQLAQTLAARPESEQVLALPDPLLRLLPDDYVATLPDDVQATVRARLKH